MNNKLNLHVPARDITPPPIIAQTFSSRGERTKQLHLSKSGMTFPVQLVPNNHGLFQSMGLDTAAGFAVLGAVAWSRLRSGLPLFPPLGAAGAPGVAKGKGGGNGESGRGGGRGRGRNRVAWNSVKVPWKLEAARVKKKVGRDGHVERVRVPVER